MIPFYLVGMERIGDWKKNQNVNQTTVQTRKRKLSKIKYKIYRRSNVLKRWKTIKNCCVNNNNTTINIHKWNNGRNSSNRWLDSYNREAVFNGKRLPYIPHCTFACSHTVFQRHSDRWEEHDTDQSIRFEFRLRVEKWQILFLVIYLTFNIYLWCNLSFVNGESQKKKHTKHAHSIKCHFSSFFVNVSKQMCWLEKAILSSYFNNNIRNEKKNDTDMMDVNGIKQFIFKICFEILQLERQQHFVTEIERKNEKNEKNDF